MRICFIADAGDIHTQRWVSYFAKRGHQVYLISWRPVSLENVNLHLVKPKTRGMWSLLPWFFLPNFIEIRQLLRKIKPDILHGHSVHMHGTHAASQNFHPLVITTWGSDVLMPDEASTIKQRLVKLVIKLLARLTLKRADLITGESDSVRQASLSLGASLEKYHLVQWGVDLALFSPESKVSQIRRDLGLDDSPTVISARKFEPVYNIGSLLRAIPHVKETIPNVKFIIKGWGSQEYELKKLAQDLGVSEQAVFVGETSHAEMPAYLNSSDVYVSIPFSDSTSVSLLEAMACRLPVIVSDLAANHEWVKDGWNGYIVSPNEPQALAKAIIELLKDKGKRELFGQRNYELAREKADFEKHMARMEELYESLLK